MRDNINLTRADIVALSSAIYSAERALDTTLEFLREQRQILNAALDTPREAGIVARMRAWLRR